MITLISGRAGEGKSAFAHLCQDVLVAEFKKNSACVSFAGKVKDTAFFMGWNGEKDDKGRRLLQEIGNAGREYDINLWASLIVESIENEISEIEYIFIDDWRFPNEGKYIRERLYPHITMRIRRPKQFHTLIDTPLYNDISEVSLPEAGEFYDYIIENNGTLDELKDKAHKFVTEILLERGK